MFEAIYKFVGTFGFLFLVMLSAPLYGQDSIAGIYKFVSIYDEVVFDVTGHFKFKYEHLNNGKEFYGTWTRINDSTVKAHSDSIVTSGLDNLPLLNDFFCIPFKESADYIWFHFSYLKPLTKDTGRFEIWHLKVASFHPNGVLKEETNWIAGGKIITSYHPNGRVSQVTEYNKKGVKNGILLKYNLEGRLFFFQYWRKGKVKKEEDCRPYKP